MEPNVASEESESERCARCGHSRSYKSHHAWRQVWADETEIPEHLRLSAHAFVPPEAKP